MTATLRDIPLPEMRRAFEAVLKEMSKGTPYGVRITRLAFPDEPRNDLDITMISIAIQINYQQPTDTRPSQQKLLTDTSISAIERGLTQAVRSVTENDAYSVTLRELERADELGSLTIVMRAAVPAS